MGSTLDNPLDSTCNSPIPYAIKLIIDNSYTRDLVNKQENNQHYGDLKWVKKSIDN